MTNASAVRKEDVIVLKVSGTTTPPALKTAVCGHIRNGKIVYLDCIGVAPNYIATKVIIMARGYLSTMGITMAYTPIFTDIKLDNPTTDKETKTAIRWILSLT